MTRRAGAGYFTPYLYVVVVVVVIVVEEVVVVIVVVVVVVVVQLIAEVGEWRRVAVDGDDDAGEGADGDVLRQREAVSARHEPRPLVVHVHHSDDDQGVRQRGQRHGPDRATKAC